MMVGHTEKNKARKGIISPSHFFILVLKRSSPGNERVGVPSDYGVSLWDDKNALKLYRSDDLTTLRL